MTSIKPSHPRRSRRSAASARNAIALTALAGALAFAGAPSAAKDAPAAAKASANAASRITEDQAKDVALKAMPGKVTGVTIEKKKGKNVYVVEIMSDNKGEVDVFVDPLTGKVVGTD